MKQEVFQNYTDQHLTILALFIFLSFFVGLIIFVYRKSKTHHFNYMSQLPLDGEPKV